MYLYIWEVHCYLSLYRQHVEGLFIASMVARV
jgi:hypothetical protein